MRTVLAVLLLVALPALGADVAFLVLEDDRAKVVAGVSEGLQSTDPLTRATAARVAAVRDVADALPRLQELLASETSPIAAREVIRAVALLAPEPPVDALIAASARFPATMDEAVTDALARRGAVGVYNTSKLLALRAVHPDFFTRALWGRGDLATATAARLVGARDAKTWRTLLSTMGRSHATVDPNVVLAALDSSSEEIRTETVWFVTRGYKPDPKVMPEALRTALLAERSEVGSDREEFGRELARRLLGRPAQSNSRWMAWLETREADELLSPDLALHELLTPAELRLRVERCGKEESRCPAPPDSRRTIPSIQVALPHFLLPEVLPAGLAARVMKETKCRDGWAGVGTATIDRVGRVEKLDLDRVNALPNCRRALATLARLSLAQNRTVNAPQSSTMTFINGDGQIPCLDESAPTERPSRALGRVGPDVVPPHVKKRQEPVFPASARSAMGDARNVLVIMEAVITKEGCVRNPMLLRQSPYPELNAAALLALSKWTFSPAMVNGQPVDVIFNLTVSFSTR